MLRDWLGVLCLNRVWTLGVSAESLQVMLTWMLLLSCLCVAPKKLLFSKECNKIKYFLSCFSSFAETNILYKVYDFDPTYFSEKHNAYFQYCTRTKSCCRSVQHSHHLLLELWSPAPPSQAFSSSKTALSSSELLTMNSNLCEWEALPRAWLSTDTWPLPDRQDEGETQNNRVLWKYSHPDLCCHLQPQTLIKI